VSLRPLIAAASTIVVAVVVALGVPVAQLRLVSVQTECCCPDPDNCHCPDHSKDRSTQPTMRACHKTQQVSISPELPVFEAIALQAIEPARATVAIAQPLPSPLPPPLPRRPDAPS